MALYDSVARLKSSLTEYNAPKNVENQIDAILADIAMNENRMQSLHSEFPAVYEAQFRGIIK